MNKIVETVAQRLREAGEDLSPEDLLDLAMKYTQEAVGAESELSESDLAAVSGGALVQQQTYDVRVAEGEAAQAVSLVRDVSVDWGLDRLIKR